jgi:hypothetical protein
MNTKKKANPQLTQQTEKLTFSLPRDDIGSTWLDVSHTTKLPSKSSTMLSLLLLFQVSSQHLFSFFFFFFFLLLGYSRSKYCKSSFCNDDAETLPAGSLRPWRSYCSDKDSGGAAG